MSDFRENGRTEISVNNWNYLKREAVSPREMVAFLKEGAAFRGFSHVLRQVYPGEDLYARLVEGLGRYSGESQDSIARKVRNWLKDKNVPRNRETLFRICFILELDETASNKVLGTVSETGIHYRNQEELIYAYALRTHKSYREAADLKERLLKTEHLSAGPQSTDTARDIYAPGQWSGKTAVYTKQIRAAFEQVDSEGDLSAFFKVYGREFGTLHETAYLKFMELLERLKRPDGAGNGKEEPYTMGQIMDLYLRMEVPQTKKVADYSLLKRLVKKCWPNESSLLNMKNRREDVSRKVMILLYLVTEAFDEMEDTDSDCYVCLDGMDEDEDADTRLEIRIKKMDLFLERYGMNRLDCGNPFDLLVLYAMKTREGDYASDRMEAVLRVLFEEEKEVQEWRPGI